MAQSKMFTIRISYRSGNVFFTGTVEQLVKYCGYTLEIGNSWNPKINRNPKTISTFISNYNKSIDEKQGSCYQRDYAYIVNPNEEGYGSNSLEPLTQF